MGALLLGVLIAVQVGARGIDSWLRRGVYGTRARVFVLSDRCCALLWPGETLLEEMSPSHGRGPPPPR